MLIFSGSEFFSRKPLNGNRLPDDRSNTFKKVMNLAKKSGATFADFPRYDALLNFKAGIHRVAGCCTTRLGYQLKQTIIRLT